MLRLKVRVLRVQGMELPRGCGSEVHLRVQGLWEEGPQLRVKACTAEVQRSRLMAFGFG